MPVLDLQRSPTRVTSHIHPLTEADGASPSCQWDRSADTVLCGPLPTHWKYTDAAAFWNNLGAIINSARSRHPSAEVLLLIDANARVGSIDSELIGKVGPYI